MQAAKQRRQKRVGASFTTRQKSEQNRCTRAVHKKTEHYFFYLLLYLKLNQTCLLQSTPLHS